MSIFENAKTIISNLLEDVRRESESANHSGDSMMAMLSASLGFMATFSAMALLFSGITPWVAIGVGLVAGPVLGAAIITPAIVGLFVSLIEQSPRDGLVAGISSSQDMFDITYRKPARAIGSLFNKQAAVTQKNASEPQVTSAPDLKM